MPNSIVSTSLSGIYDAYKRISERAERISQFALNEQDDSALVTDIIGLKSDVYSIQANGKVIKTDQELTKSILDILA